MTSYFTEDQAIITLLSIAFPHISKTEITCIYLHVYPKNICKTLQYLITNNGEQMHSVNQNKTNHNHNPGFPNLTVMKNPELEPETNIKIAVIGDMSVGKSTLLVKYIDNYFDAYLSVTIGYNIMTTTTKAINYRNTNTKPVHLEFRDMSGSQNYSQLLPVAIKDAQIIIFTFALNQKSSLLNIKHWYKKVKRRQNQNTQNGKIDDKKNRKRRFLPVLIGTKYDLLAHSERKNPGFRKEIVSIARKYARKMHAPLIFTSSKYDINIEALFELLVCWRLKQEINIIMSHDAQNEPIFEYSNILASKKQN